MLCKVNEDGSLSEVASNGGGLINDEKTSASETWSSKKIEDDLTELKKSVSDGKEKVANAITLKGVATESDATFATIVENIGKIGLNLKILNYVTHADGTHNDTFEVEKDGRYIVIGNVNADGRANSTLTISVDGKTPLETKREANVIAYQDNVRRTNNIHQCSIYDLQQGDVIKCSTYVYGYGAVSFTVIGIE